LAVLIDYFDLFSFFNGYSFTVAFFLFNEKTGIWSYQNSSYWVSYNGELPYDSKAEYAINSDDLFIVATVS
jgi:hypothetical protein